MAASTSSAEVLLLKYLSVAELGPLPNSDQPMAPFHTPNVTEAVRPAELAASSPPQREVQELLGSFRGPFSFATPGMAGEGDDAATSAVNGPHDAVSPEQHSA